MTYEYKVLHESDYRILEHDLNNLGYAGWKLVNVFWNEFESLMIATLIRER